MGGTHVAYANDFYTLLMNPAALAEMPKTIGILELTTGIHGPLLKLIKPMIDLSNSDGSSIPDMSWISEVFGKKGGYIGFDLGGPISGGFINKGFGIGLFNRTFVDVSIRGNNIGYTVNEDVFLTGGYGYKILNRGSHVLDIGLLGKIFYRFSMDNIFSLFSLIDSGEITFPLTNTFGFGFDMGVQYTWAEALTTAIAYRDFVSPAYSSRYTSFDMLGGAAETLPVAFVRPSLDIGVAYKVPIPFGALNLMLDYRDFTDLIIPQSYIVRNPILNIGLGAEYTLFNILSFRAGLADMLPAVGIGLHVRGFAMDFAIKGKEIGLDPGVQPVYVIELGILSRL
jgi:hypothetical protein